MKIGAYQFEISDDVLCNLNTIKRAITLASQNDIKILAFPECALTGYPPKNIKNSAAVNFKHCELAYKEIRNIASGNDIFVILGSVTKNCDNYFNSALLFTPDRKMMSYHKRALWGWDADNFKFENTTGVFELGGLKVGVRICFEIRFPEFFRELYHHHTDLNIILFNDVSDQKDDHRYEMIKSHIQTRAVENVTYILSVNNIFPCQTAPTMICDRSGRILKEQPRNEEGLLVYDLQNTPLNWGEEGRKKISDWLTAKKEEDIDKGAEKIWTS
ncbi:hypothetical protein B5F07_18010 [Lachnoclostridium sp. An169]|uniref:carbon-nitrogen hydrolase family protein n=1 Tax=Lachnoclostridium sp. An169 TaxID=1965569 RepID=UPI000B3821B3|nr:carbon-nitrogen hydrolase family protein [Lachnoclostridium sp. An169]OUP81252.1 hypothetical protein B5F07_18010 [Lachnoclostridium sp. An169]